MSSRRIFVLVVLVALGAALIVVVGLRGAELGGVRATLVERAA